MVLGMIPLARELLRGGSEVVLVANSQPAINDITLPELREVLQTAGGSCPVLAVGACIAAQLACSHVIPAAASWLDAALSR